MFEGAWFSWCTCQVQRLLPWRRKVREAAMDPVDEVFLRLRDYWEAHSDPTSLEDTVIRQVLDHATGQVRNAPAVQQPTPQKARVPKASALVRAH